MLDITLTIAILIGSFYFLIKSADNLVESASIIGKRLGFSKFIIGLTIVAIGTSLPELAASLIGAITSQSPQSFVFGTILGSNISNIFFVFGILLLFSKNFRIKLLQNDLTMLIMSTLMIIGVVLYQELNIMIGIVMISIYLYYLYTQIKHKKKEKFEEEAQETVQESEFSKQTTTILIIIFILSLITMNVAAKGIVFAIEILGIMFNIPIAYLTLTTLALATSLPEAFVIYSCAKTRDFEIAIGNIIGSNISNVFLITGITGLVKTFTFSYAEFQTSIIFLIIATVIFSIAISKPKYTNKYLGVGFILFYIIFILITIF